MHSGFKFVKGIASDNSSN